MTNKKLITRDQKDAMAPGAAAHTVWLDQGLPELIEKSPVGSMIHALNVNVETYGYSLPWDDFVEMMNQVAMQYSNGSLMGSLFNCVLEHDANPETENDPEFKGHDVYEYSGSPFPDSDHIEMNILLPHGVKVMETIVHIAEDGTETPVLCNIALRPEVPAELNGGKALMSPNWTDRSGMKNRSAYNRMFVVWTGDLIGVEGIRRTIQRVCTMTRNEGKALGYATATGDKGKEFQKQNQVSIQLKERQIMISLMGSIKIAMDKHVARSEWEFHFDRTLTPEAVENRRLALSSRFDMSHPPSTVVGEQAYCETYTNLMGIMSDVDENGRRNIQGVIEILEKLMSEPHTVNCHVLFVTEAMNILRKERNNCRAGRLWNENEASLGEQAAATSVPVSTDVANMNSFFSSLSVVGENKMLKEGSEAKPLNKPKHKQAVVAGGKEA